MDEPASGFAQACALSRLILALHREGRQVALGRFPGWAFELLREQVAFDAACWGLTSADPPLVREMHLEPEAVGPDEADRWSAEANALREALISRPGVAVHIQDLNSQATGLRRACSRRVARRLRLASAIGVCLAEPAQGFREFVILWRREPEDPFAESDRQFLEMVMPHLVDARRTVRMLHFGLLGHSAHRAWALVDREGWVREASPGFLAAMRACVLGWNGTNLPGSFVAQIKEGRGPTLPGLRFDVTVHGELYCLLASPTGGLDLLSARERQIIGLYASGNTYSAIASALGLSPATVRNHIAHCYRKLAVNNKTELCHRLAGNA